MATRNVRRCPVCGLELGQKNICPVCAGQPAQGSKKLVLRLLTQPKTSSSLPRKDQESNAGAGAAPSSSAPVPAADRLVRYQQLKKELAGNPQDFDFVYRTVQTLLKDYPDFFRLDHVNFFVEMVMTNCPFAIFALMMDEFWNTQYSLLMNCSRTSTRMRADVNYQFAPPDWPVSFLNTKGKFQLFVFKYLPAAVYFSILGQNYSNCLDISRTNSKKPIKMVYVRGWSDFEKLEGADKKVLVLFYGKCVEFGPYAKTPDNASSAKKTKANKVDDDSFAGFPLLNGLRCRSKKKIDMKMPDHEFVLLYMSI